MRALYCLTIGVTLALSGWACQSGEDRSSGAVTNIETVDPSNQKIVFWYQHTREREEELLALVDEFNRTNSYGIEVQGEYAGRYDNIYNKMWVGLQGGTLPNLVVAYQNQAQAYYEAEGIVDLQLYMDSAKWGLSAEDKADYFPAFLQQDNIDGVQICFPPNRSMEVFFYNMDWLKELGYVDQEGRATPPQTWDQFAEMSRKAQTHPFSKAVNKDRTLGFILEADASRLASMVFSRGGDFINAQRSAYTLNTPQVHSALGLMRQLVEEGAVDLLSEDYEDQSEFAAGQVLFAMRSSSGLPFFETAVKSGVDFDWDVGAPPHSVDQPTVNVYGASLAICNTEPEKQLASWLFVKWFTEPQQQARWVTASNYFPVRRSTAAQLEDYFSTNPRYKQAFDLLEHGKSEPTLVGYEPVRRLIQKAVVRAIEGEPLDQLLGQLEQEANAQLE